MTVILTHVFKLLSFFILIFAVFDLFIVTLSHLRFCDSAFENLIRFNIMYTKFCQNPTTFSMGYGNLTIFKMAAVRHVGFWKLAVFIMWSLSARHSASPYKISPKSDNRSMNYDQKSEFQDGGCRHLEFQIFYLFFGHVTVTGFNIWCSVPNFIKIGQFFTEIWRLNFTHLHFLSRSLCQHAVLLSHTKFRWNRTIG